MKKLLVIGVAIICVAFAAPALAKVRMGGMITTDVMYTSTDGGFDNPTAKNVVNGANGTDRTIIGFPQAHNRLNAHYENDDGTLLGVIELRDGAYGSKGDNLTWYYGWLDWRPYSNDSFHLRVGRQPETFSIMVPSAAGMGHTEWTLLVNYGNLHASNGDMVKAYVRFNDNIRLEFAVQDPDNDNDSAALGGFPAENGNGARVQEENVIPRFDVSLPMKFGNFSIEPSATYLKTSYDQIAAGYEDSFDIWGFSVGAKMGFGPVTISAEGTYGQNLGAGNYTGAGGTRGFPIAISARPTAVDMNRDGIFNDISDADIWMGWIQADFNFGPATLKMAVGAENVQNDQGPGAADDIDTTRYGYAVALPIKVAKGFTVMPNFVYHDRDSDARDGSGLTEVDYGSEWMMGVQFNLVF